MYHERVCSKCKGAEYRLMHAATVQGWHAAPVVADGMNEHWFCPACDWGSLAEREDIIR